MLQADTLKKIFYDNSISFTTTTQRDHLYEIAKSIELPTCEDGVQYTKGYFHYSKILSQHSDFYYCGDNNVIPYDTLIEMIPNELKISSHIDNILDTHLLGKHYIPVDRPTFRGKGNHSVKQLEEMCLQFEEYCHQQQVIKQKLIEKITNTAQS